MTEPQMREVVMAFFKAAWDVQAPTVPLVLENEAFPSSFDTLCMMTIVPTTSSQSTMGRAPFRRVKRNAWIQIKLWAATDVGSAPLSALGDVAQGILELKSLPSPLSEDDPVTILASQASASGLSTDGRWYQALFRMQATWFEQK